MKSVADHLAAECALTSPSLPMFEGLYAATKGDPCRTGCAYFDGGRCPAFRLLYPDAPPPKNARNQRDSNAGYVRPGKKPFKW